MTTALLVLADEAAYRAHYVSTYCARPIITREGFPVYFSPDKFDHAFFESTQRNGVKDAVFSPDRCERMNWIHDALTATDATRVHGYDSKTKKHVPDRCVCIVHGDFVVVIRLGFNARGQLKGNFVTCFRADNSIGKIRSAPTWTPADVPPPTP